MYFVFLLMAFRLLSSLFSKCNLGVNVFCSSSSRFINDGTNVLKLHLPNGTESSLSIHTSSAVFKEELPFQYVPEVREKSIFTSGDQEDFSTPDLIMPQMKFEGSKELKTADDAVKKILSLQFASRKETVKKIKADNIKMVQRHQFDVGSLESQVAAMTVRIRAMQLHMRWMKRDYTTTISLKELIDRRLKMLRKLRKNDYQRFEWLLSKLKIIYHPPQKYVRTTRKSSLKEMTMKYCENLRKARLEEYHDKLKKQQEDFLKAKDDMIKWIADEEKTLGLPPSSFEDLVEGDTKTIKVPTTITAVAKFVGENEKKI